MTTEERVKMNERNISALVDTINAQGDAIKQLQERVEIQSRSIITLGNDLASTRAAMAAAAATMGTGPTVRNNDVGND